MARLRKGPFPPHGGLGAVHPATRARIAYPPVKQTEAAGILTHRSDRRYRSVGMARLPGGSDADALSEAIPFRYRRPSGGMRSAFSAVGSACRAVPRVAKVGKRDSAPA